MCSSKDRLRCYTGDWCGEIYLEKQQEIISTLLLLGVESAGVNSTCSLVFIKLF